MPRRIESISVIDYCAAEPKKPPLDALGGCGRLDPVRTHQLRKKFELNRGKVGEVVYLVRQFRESQVGDKRIVRWEIFKLNVGNGDLELWLIAVDRRCCNFR